jgi:AbrB family looped-hinge helix DNA binding protein
MEDFYMKSTKTIDSIGRITIPIDMRRELRLMEGDVVDVICEDNTITIRKPKAEDAISNLQKMAEDYADNETAVNLINQLINTLNR